MGMVAWAYHSETPEILGKNDVSILAAELPPMLPKMPPILAIDGVRAVDSPVLQKAGEAEQEAFGGRLMVTKQLEFCSLGQDQERNFVQLVAKSDGERLEKGFVHAMDGCRPVELICLSLHSDASDRLEKGIDRPGWKPSERSATAARMRDPSSSCSPSNRREA